jgi:anthranilate phosphoribosyltransferase
LVVHGSDGLDEVTLSGTTEVIELTGGKLRRFNWQPADFGLEPASRETMLVSGPQESAAMICDILAGRRGPPRDIVVANAAAALWTVGRSGDLLECVRLVQEAIDTGAARGLLARLVERTAHS